VLILANSPELAEEGVDAALEVGGVETLQHGGEVSAHLVSGFVVALEEKGAETLLGDHLADCPKKLSSRQSSG
jgi:hypothetical protein